MKIQQIQVGTIPAMGDKPASPVLYAVTPVGEVYYGRWTVEDDGKGGEKLAFSWDGVLPQPK